MGSERAPKTLRHMHALWSDYVEPTDAVEHHLASLWSDALDIEPVGVEDNFFELGGHSILAAELIATLRKEFDVELTDRAIFLWPTIADLAAELRQRVNDGFAAPI